MAPDPGIKQYLWGSQLLGNSSLSSSQVRGELYGNALNYSWKRERRDTTYSEPANALGSHSYSFLIPCFIGREAFIQLNAKSVF